MNRISMIKLILFILVALPTMVLAQSRQKSFNLEDRLAIQGYDPTAYFVEHKALKGKKSLSYDYEGVTYYFASPEARKLFIGTPAKFEPQYGGWCAYAMGATGEKVEIDPETFKIVDGKLYLFYNKFFTNTLPKWNSAEEDLKKKADNNWKTTIDKQ